MATAHPMSPMSAPPSVPLPVAVIGAGAIGRVHAQRCAAHSDLSLAAIADPSAAAREFAARADVPWFADHRQLFEKVAVSAAVVAVPTAMHLQVGLDCIVRGLPLLMEKPIAATLEDGQALCDSAEAAGVALLVGHHRRHNPIQRRARALIDAGVLGRPVTGTVMATWLKPDSYFDIRWRCESGGGPVLINLIHDIDQLRFMLGEVVEVQAMASNHTRGLAVEDSAAVLLRFANGALGALVVSDCAAAPWGWDLCAGEAPHYPRQDVDTMFLCGTEGSLTLPRLSVWRYVGGRGWQDELTVQRCIPHAGDPYHEQLRHLRAVAEGRETALCSGRDGLRTLAVALAALESARTRKPAVPAQ